MIDNPRQTMRSFIRLVEAFNKPLLAEGASFYYVMVKDGVAKVLPDSDETFEQRSALERDGWEVIWDSARSEDAGYQYAWQFRGIVPEDDHKPRAMKKPMVLYRSVSMPELVDVLRSGVVSGMKNVFNGFDTRRYVFFGPKMDSSLISQGEEVERKVQTDLRHHPLHQEFAQINVEILKARAQWVDAKVAAIEKYNRSAKKAGARPIDVTPDQIDKAKQGYTDAVYYFRNITMSSPQIQDAQRDLYDLQDDLRSTEASWHKVLQSRSDTESKGRLAMPFTSAVLQTRPIDGGLHYSKKHGLSGMKGDEYGFRSQQVTTDDITRIYLMKNGAKVREGSVDEIASLIDQTEWF